jgi:hypothetical protein
VATNGPDSSEESSAGGRREQDEKVLMPSFVIVGETIFNASVPA